MELSRYADLFLSESRAHVSGINHHLLELERSGDLAEVEEIFRSAHTLKGMSAAMGCQAAADLAHALEHLLDRLRSSSVELDEAVMEVLFEGTDALEQTISAELAGDAPPPEVPPILARLHLVAGAPAAEEEEGVARADAGVQGDAAAGPAFEVTVMIQAAAALPAVRAMLVLRTVREIGQVSDVEPGEDRLLAADFAGTLRFVLRTREDPEAVRLAVLRAGEVSHVVIEKRDAHAGQRELTPAESAVLAGSSSGRGPDHFVRIEQERLDSLVEHIGELVIARDRLNQLLARQPDAELDDASDAMSRLIARVRDEVMGMRMVPIGDAFDRFPRFVRDAARSLRKKVEFQVVGRDTPLDRALHNELSDLLIHLLRNALDHGVEPEAERVAAGKPPLARVRLTAERVREQVEVRVEDDGRGISRERVKSAAVQAGLLSPAAAEELGDQEILQLVTRPGFSTVDRVTDVSGRGVGLDVVASRVRALGGALEIESEPGRGTSFSLRLPLSLAILRTLQVEVAGSIYVIPISAIDEVAELQPDGAAAWQSETVGEFEFREETIPLLHLGDVLRPGSVRSEVANAPVVVLYHPDGIFGVVVDSLRGQHEAVLKPFDAPRRMTDVFAGATILSDGRPALILDAMKLKTWANRSPEPTAVHGAPDLS